VLSYGKNTAKTLSERGGLRWSFWPARRYSEPTIGVAAFEHQIGAPSSFDLGILAVASGDGKSRQAQKAFPGSSRHRRFLACPV
jgi:hypothetical protein